MTTNNPFTDFMKSWTNSESYNNLFKNVPDLSSYNEMINKGTKIITTTNKMIAENIQSNIQSIGEKTTKIFQDNTNNMINSTKDAIESFKDPKKMMEHHQKHSKLNGEMLVKVAKEGVNILESSMQTFQNVIEHLNENINDVTEQMKKTTGPVKVKV